jgi:hypothetical protein
LVFYSPETKKRRKEERKYERKRKKRGSITEIERRGKAQQKEEEEGKHNRKGRRGKAQERGRERALHVYWSAITSPSKLLAATSQVHTFPKAGNLENASIAIIL